MTSGVLCSQQAQVGIITLNRPLALHALSLPMVRALYRQLRAWEVDPGIHAVVIRAEGSKAFCAGGDVRWLYEAGKRHDPEQLQFFLEEYQLNRLIHHYSKPYIALMDGITFGGGVGVSLHGSHPVATEAFVFAMPETNIGFFPDIGASYLLSRCADHLGIYLGLTGNRLNADEALSLGLVRHLVDSTQLPLLLQTLVETDLSVQAAERVTACLTQFSKTTAAPALIALQQQVATCFIQDTVEDIVKALDCARTAWHRDVLATLLAKSPMSLKVTLEQLKRAKSLDFDACIAMDAVLVKHFVADADFYEGVRALLIDKDKSPQWRQRCLSEVSQSSVDQYFR